MGDTTKIKREKANCSFCKGELMIIPYDVKHYKNHFCNMQCRNNFLKDNPPRNWLGKKLSEDKNLKLQKARKEYQSKNRLYNEIDLSQKKDFILDLYLKGNTLGYISEQLNVSKNTIMRNMEKWGIKRRVPLRDKIEWRADDGHLVKSSAEMYIDNWLFHNGIIHIYEKSLGETRFKCDFYIPETNSYIENWGMINKDYIKKMKKKLEMYQKLGLITKLVSIFPKDKIEDKLRFLLSISKIQRSIEQYEK